MPVMNIYASDDYYMPVMNIIYACDDICDLCEYLRLLEKRKKRKKRKNSSPRAKAIALGEGGSHHCGGTVLRQEQKAQLSTKSPLQREPNIWLSVKSPPSMRAKYLSIGEEPFFNESQIFGSRRRSGPHS
jgi:hypothetical protein